MNGSSVLYHVIGGGGGGIDHENEGKRWLRVQVTEALMNGSEPEVEGSALAHSSPLKLAATGMLFGLIHVLTGPDHLSALATLSAGSSWRSFALGIRWGCGHSIGLIIMAIIFISLDGKLDFTVLNVVTDVLVGVFMVGLGIYGVIEGYKNTQKLKKGHHPISSTGSHHNSTGSHNGSQKRNSSGHFILRKLNKHATGAQPIPQESDEELEENGVELTSFDKKKQQHHISLQIDNTDDKQVDSSDSNSGNSRKRHVHLPVYGEDEEHEMELDLEEETSDEISLSKHDHLNKHVYTNSSTISTCSSTKSTATMETSSPDDAEHDHLVMDGGDKDDKDDKDTIEEPSGYERFRRKLPACLRKIPCPEIDFKNPQTQKYTALLVGIVHGIAGPGGILGVLPAVGLHDWIKSFTYLGSFCFTSIMIMGLFAAMYGEATGRLGQRSELIAFRISIFSSLLSVIVGVLWLVLAAIGKLQAVFG